MARIRPAGDGAAIAVLARESDPTLLRYPSPVERRYREVWERSRRWWRPGVPLARSGRSRAREPRVGDGVLIFDREARVDYASPNAVSRCTAWG
ncbi:MAG: hypothetical protein R2695_04905 [Acidimicrobiales bacterium]